MEEKKDTYKIDSRNEDKFNFRIEKINKKARKLGLPEVRITEISRKHIPAVHAFEVAPEIHLAHPAFDLIELKIEGEPPFIPGWELIATIEHNADIGNIIRTAPEKECPKEYWDSNPVCDHCQTKRPRKTTIILKSTDTGEFKQIGSNCCSDFLPGISAQQVAEWLKFCGRINRELDNEDWDHYSGPRIDPVYETENILKISAALIRVDGYRSKKATFGQTTASDIYRYLNPPVKGSSLEDWLVWIAERKITDADKAKASKVLEWILNHESTSEYFHNLIQYAKSGSVNGRGFGLLGSAVIAYMKEIEKFEFEKKAPKLNEHFGEIGQRIRGLELTVKIVRSYESQFGTGHLYVMDDAEGRRFCWFSGGSRKMDEVDAVTLTGTVKAHKLYQERKQTILTRCKVEKIVNQEQVANG